MTTPEVIGIFAGIPLAICGAITAAVYGWERISAGRRQPDTSPTAAAESHARASEVSPPSSEDRHETEKDDREEKA